MATAAAAAVSSQSAGLLAELVEAEARRHAACATRSSADADPAVSSRSAGLLAELVEEKARRHAACATRSSADADPAVSSRSAGLPAELVEAEACPHTACATRSSADADPAVSSRFAGLLAELVEAEARRHAACATRLSTDVDPLLRTFRGGATPEESVGQFLNRIYRAGWVEGTCFVLAGIYLARFLRSRAAVTARIRVEPATAHRLVAVALYISTKFGGHPYKGWTGVFEVCSGYTIRAPEMITLERRFLRAIDYRLFVRTDVYNSFVRVLVAGPPTWAPLPTPPALEPVSSVNGGLAGKRKVAGDDEGDRLHHARRVRRCLLTTTRAADPSVTSSN